MNKFRCRAAFAAFLAATLTASSLAIWQPAAAHAVQSEGCSLQPSGHAGDGEWLSCLRVSAALDSLPAAGQEATLVFEVTAQFERSGLTVEAQLPSNLEWTGLPEGFASRDSHLATGTIAVGGNETRRFTGTVLATEPGGAQISVRAVAPPVLNPEDGSVISQESAGDHQFLTVAEAGGQSTPGIEGGPEGIAWTGQPTSEPTLATVHLEHSPVPEEQRPGAAATIMAPGDTSCVKGTIGYQEGPLIRLSPNITVEVWDADWLDAADLLVTGITNGQGFYNLCFPSDDPDGPFVGFSQDVFLRYYSSNSRWREQEPGTQKVYSWDTPVVWELAASATHNFGHSMPSDPKYHLGLQAFDAVNDFWNWKPPAQCWDGNDTAANCKQMVINWRWDANPGTRYDNALKQVFMDADHPKFRMATVHEAAHAVMDDVYEGTPIPGAGGPHSVQSASNVGMAWTEGFAEWVPTTLYVNPTLLFPTVTSNLETPTWGTPFWDNGDLTEGRVAAALMDISDGAQDTPWDRLNEGLVPGNIWKTFLGPAIGPPRVQKNFKDFWNHRGLDGFIVNANLGLSTLFNNTIDYTFRDPLFNNTPALRPQPVVPHNFSFSTSTFFWSVVAIRPGPFVDHDMKLFEDFGLTTQIGSSGVAGSTVDFIAIDSNKKALTDYYPQVTQFSGVGSYRIELAQTSLSLGANSSQAVSLGATNVVAVRDTFLNSGATVTIKVTPAAGQDLELFLMRSISGQPATFVRPRGQAFKTAAAAGPGLVESFTFVAPATDWYGVVIVNKAGSGSLTLQRIG